MSFFPSIFGHQKDKSAASLKTLIDQVFDSFMQDWPQKSMFSDSFPAFFNPPVDVAETKEGLEVKIDLPDMNKDDIHLELHGDHLMVSGEKKTEKQHAEEKGYHVMERSFGSFRRAIPLPFHVEDNQSVNANYAKGVLSVLVSRPANEQAMSNKIPIG